MRTIKKVSQGLDVAKIIRKSRSGARGYADTIHNRLMTQIGGFEASLDRSQEVGAYLAAFGREHLVRIERVGYQNPFLIFFEGRSEPGGERVRLVQHTSQLSILLVALPAQSGGPPRRIGFLVDDDPAASDSEPVPSEADPA